MKVVPMNRPLKGYSMEELFYNHTENQNQVNLNNSSKIIAINKRIDGMRTVIIALFLALIASTVGCGLAIHKMMTTPTQTTIYIDGTAQTVDIDKLPLAPLEELK